MEKHKYHLNFIMKDGSTLSSNTDLKDPSNFGNECLTAKYFIITDPQNNTLVICVDQISSVMITLKE